MACPTVFNEHLPFNESKGFYQISCRMYSLTNMCKTRPMKFTEYNTAKRYYLLITLNIAKYNLSPIDVACD
ncbi:hypothetical protein EWB00_002387 [Schistosoma japonicum]|uniref:Uncharacterized protein n=1 Tax=Schistosoma japonicum TaxID=6182 RepID=A0A4Z2DD56_SCHJA|nr:hypothetical protein EWB00_002387 [Schistosoma japonicum]